MSSTNLKDYIGYGNKADRPASPAISTATSGFYYAIDTEELSYWKGSWGAWRSAAGTSKTLQAITSASSVTPAATDDVVVVSALAANLAINAPAGTHTGQDTIVFKIKDNGTTRTLTWDAAYVWMVTAVTATTVSKWHYFTAIYNATDSKWHITGSVVQP